ncbi:EAL domain-containing protein [Sphingomicrobium clamense]|uniref:EAL domain-containing protein n=1 Tax=Sphingomicrobium clamense TaxID=2851013 RepID=A0ABS6V6T5_9SPHN|nr:EAL domain-containing protein [Sphingomicrobium sp. B8]
MAPKRDRKLEAAIAGDEIGLRYQPQLDPMTGEVVGVEALARWSGEEDAGDLFRRAADARLDERLSRQVAEKAIRRAARWRGSLATVCLSINLLPSDLAHDDYPDWLLTQLERQGFAPERLTVEIVESDLLSDSGAAAARLQRLRDVGIRVAIDDFGTGYASLAWLTGLPIDTLKIDRELITDIVGKDRDRIVVRAMLRLAQDLEMKTIVEGVECSAQLALLADWGCDLYQGFLGSEPLSEEELHRFVRTANLAVA